MSAAINDRRALYLLLSLVLMILLSPFLGTHRLGEVILVMSMFVALITAILELHGKRTFRWLAIAVAVPVALTLLGGPLTLSFLTIVTGERWAEHRRC
jgi:hypothetical protein